MCTVGRSLSVPRAQYGQQSAPLTWMSTPACPSRTGAELFHQTRAPPACAATCPAHHSAHCGACAPAIPIVAHCPGSSTAVDRRTRRRMLVARPGHTLARMERGGEAELGSPARTRASAAPSQPLRRRRIRQENAITNPHKRTTAAAARATNPRGALAAARSRHPMKATMTSTESRGAPRRRDAPVNEPRPRRSTPGHARRRGRGRTSKTSSPRLRRVPGVRACRVRRVLHLPSRVRTRNGGDVDAGSRTARPPFVEKSACSRATLAHDRGTSPARPTVPGASTRPTSGPAVHARCRSVRKADLARQPESFMSQRSRRARGPSSAARGPVDNRGQRKTPVDNQPACPVAMATSSARAPRTPSAGCPKCKNGPHG